MKRWRFARPSYLALLVAAVLIAGDRQLGMAALCLLGTIDDVRAG